MKVYVNSGSRNEIKKTNRYSTEAHTRGRRPADGSLEFPKAWTSGLQRWRRQLGEPACRRVHITGQQQRWESDPCRRQLGSEVMSKIRKLPQLTEQTGSNEAEALASPREPENRDTSITLPFSSGSFILHVCPPQLYCQPVKLHFCPVERLTDCKCAPTYTNDKTIMVKRIRIYNV
ncbi:hypothetical protein NDU88_006235 [Pleurodeles waltl]|uniref:Uncharacterized protein n=1 Tax=Pleurodeles waltl TaxID=8319 RepID=A0AAV7N1R7_PLEWA|nr:hypothetical protein NDU88_006235 [Pleurodeles waltl]